MPSVNSSASAEPERAAVLEPVPGLLEAGDLRQQEVQRDDRQHDEDREPDEVARGQVEPGRVLLVLDVLAPARSALASVLAARGLHPRALASSAWTPAATRPNAGAASGAARRTASVSASPAARSTT